jgi:hypothetical protein
MYEARLEAKDDRGRAGTWLLIYGTIFPAAVIIIELVTRLCASSFFDPLPTPAHILLTSFVPATNLLLWLALRDERTADSRWLMMAGGGAAAIALSYSLIFLPLLPLALIGIMIAGLGLLPFGPVAAAFAAIKQSRGLYEAIGRRHGRRAWAGAALGVSAVLVADLPSTATLLALRWADGDPANISRSVTLMRTLGDRDMLLRLCYESDRRANGLGSALVSLWDGPFGNEFDRGADTATARELYYRVTGEAFNLRPPPYTRGAWAEANDFQFDEDQGGTQVGGRLRGLGLASSRIDGSVSADDALAYVEWTMEFDNRSAQQREARLTLALPPGAVASRATLWVNGEPREAAVASRAKTRAAYERIVVRERRDPLLVTTDGADRLLVQAFPIQPQGQLKLRIGMTAPLEIGGDGRMTMAPPAIADRNFSIGEGVQHLVWMDSARPLAATHPGLAAPAPGQVRGELSDSDLARGRPRIDAGKAEPSSRHASLPRDGKLVARSVTQTIGMVRERPASALMLVVDGSATGEAARSGLLSALAAIPQGARVGLTIAAQEGTEVPLAPWSRQQRVRFERVLHDHDFIGGQDNADALADATARLAGERHGVLLWIHGPQPVAFARSGAKLEQLAERTPSLPRLLLYQVAPGPQRMLGRSDWTEAARIKPASGAVAKDLTAVLADTLTDAPRLRALRSPGAGGAAEGSPHIARLWAAEEIQRLSSAGRREEAIALASQAGVVTPVSGAVVLETDADYKDNGLAVPKAADVPTIPEPEVWALMILALLAAAWYWHRSGARLATA